MISHNDPLAIFNFETSILQKVWDEKLKNTRLLLDTKQIQAFLEQIQQTRSNIWNRLRLDGKTVVDQLIAMDILGKEGEGTYPTFAGLLVFGTWLQKLYPSRMISFVRFFGTTSATKGPRGERFQDNAQFKSSLYEVINQAVSQCITNMKQATEGVLHRMIPEYPAEALREALVNAVAHRDYSSYVLGSYVRIEMYADRLEIISPGGLFGPVSLANLETMHISAQT